MNTKKYNCLDYLRAFSMFLVMWPHLTYVLNPNWDVGNLLCKVIYNPLGLTGYASQLGVCIFFLISGFLLINNDGAFKFISKRLLRLVIPYWGIMIAFYVFQSIYNTFVVATYWDQFSIIDWLKTLLLYRYFSGETEPINGVLWYLVVLLMLYAFEFVRKCIKLKPDIAICIYNIIFIIVYKLELITRISVLAFLPYLGIIFSGVLLALIWKRAITVKRFIIGMLVNCCSMFYGFYSFIPDKFEGGYLISYFYAVSIFAIMLLAEEKIKYNKIIKFFSDMSYSFYISHSLYGGLIISDLLARGLPFEVTVMIGIIFAVVAGWVNYFCIEKNCNKLFRKIGGRNENSIP